ncbi:hypothetical protein LOK49_LG03G02315 [Camellia lanceoleosa]|uniref:Uncharacterized protein n=1 Tax=Camellia lanceoleosa TaxID=1840588 RepID=A0ACC0IBI3_9ERIC|nr:hypothetical protein LOK49_LG03G02315 [Camellia lanceoleosa]
MVSGVSRKRPTASNRRRARQTEPEPLEVNVPVEEDDHVDTNNDYVDDDIGVENDDVDNDISVEADLMEDDVGVDDDNTELVPGAPEDSSLLISFRNHVAAAVWKKKVIVLWSALGRFTSSPNETKSRNRRTQPCWFDQPWILKHTVPIGGESRERVTEEMAEQSFLDLKPKLRKIREKLLLCNKWLIRFLMVGMKKMKLLLDFCLGPPASSLHLLSFTSLDKEPCPRGTRESKLVERKASRIGNNIQETQMGCIARVGLRFHFRSQPPMAGQSFTRV